MSRTLVVAFMAGRSRAGGVDMSTTLMRARIDGGRPSRPIPAARTRSGPSRSTRRASTGADQAGNIFVGDTGQTSRVLLSNGGFSPGIALDATSVYWIGGSSIYRTPK